MQTRELPESRGYRFKKRVLGEALPNEAMAHQRLGKPTALAVFSSDALSSTAYATEEILKTLIFAGIGLAAFDYVFPITVAMTLVLVILMFSYRQTIKAYPSAGGAYIVTKDNLGIMPAQVAGVALLTDYILTVAVSVSAGVAALYSAFNGLRDYAVPIALMFIVIIAVANLRGVKESGRIFAVPTYGFVLSVFAMIIIGFIKLATGDLHPAPITDPAALEATRNAGLFLILHAFASGGAAVTGVEAISNGVPAFKAPEWKNARTTLTIMGTMLGIMFLGLSFLATKIQPLPNDENTVISQIAKATVGNGLAFYFVQAMTMLILVLAANTSFADFPRLASFAAEDSFMPRQLAKRGHRLVFSNGIIFLSLSGAFLVVLFRAEVDKLIPLYAIGVFTSFTLSQAGMSVHHVRLKEQGWRIGLAINGLGAVATLVVTIVVGITKFTHGAWAIILMVPFLVAALIRVNKEYEFEDAELARDAHNAAAAPILRRHAVFVLVDKLDRSAARAIQYGRSLMPSDLRAVHIATDTHKSDHLADSWQRLGLSRIPLELVDCPDRRIDRAVRELVADALADGQTEVSVLVPRREYRRSWHRLLHDRTSNTIARAVAPLPHANVTFVPYHFGHEASAVTAESAEAPAPAEAHDQVPVGR